MLVRFPYKAVFCGIVNHDDMVFVVTSEILGDSRICPVNYIYIHRKVLFLLVHSHAAYVLSLSFYSVHLLFGKKQAMILTASHNIHICIWIIYYIYILYVCVFPRPVFYWAYFPIPQRVQCQGAWIASCLCIFHGTAEDLEMWNWVLRPAHMAHVWIKTAQDKW